MSMHMCTARRRTYGRQGQPTRLIRGSKNEKGEGIIIATAAAVMFVRLNFNNFHVHR